MLEVDMWVSYTEYMQGTDFYYRIRRANEIRRMMAIVDETKEDYDAYSAEVTKVWNTANYQNFTAASWNYNLAKKELDELVSQTLHEISLWKRYICN